MGLVSGIQDAEKIYSGSRIQGSKRHRIPDPDPQHWIKHSFLLMLPKVICANIHDGKIVTGCQYGTMVVWDLSTVMESGMGRYSQFSITFRHRKNSFSIFPSRAGMSQTKSPWAEIIYLWVTSLFPLRESLVSDIPARDGNMEKLFLWCVHL